MTFPIYLASQSPRRLELLRQIGLSPQILPLRHAHPRADVVETPHPDEPALAYVQRLAGMKAEAGLAAIQGRRLPAWPLLAADTTVTLDGAILGKPADDAEAAAMLRQLAGREHTVLTAVGLAHGNRVQVVTSESIVRFKPLSQAEIAAYIASREPFDKAGSYGIQGRAAMFIEHLSGSYSGVMGLPLFETAQLLRDFGFQP